MKITTRINEEVKSPKVVIVSKLHVKDVKQTTSVLKIEPVQFTKLVKPVTLRSEGERGHPLQWNLKTEKSCRHVLYLWMVLVETAL